MPQQAMASGDDTNRLLETHRALRCRLTHVWNAFFARFGTLRPIQLAAIEPILNSHNVLVTAPTAGGKTEAVAAPVCERLVSERWQGLSVLLITPTRALVNDLYERLLVPCQELGVRLGRKTADHAVSHDFREQFLITTPESAESLLTFRRESLSSLRAVIMDEIHLLDGTPRGDQLRLLLQRLQRYLAYVRRDDPSGLQRIALSATVADPRRVADLYAGTEAKLITVAGQRAIDARVVLSADDDEQRARAAVQAAASFDDVRKVLVFVNSRRQVDVGAQYFQQGPFERIPVYGHHGSLSKSQRETVEARFRTDARAICVATMTLEIGIDIGDVDLVVCIDPPYSLSSFLQRIGRGCRRLQGRTRVVCVARDRASQLLLEGMIQQAGAGIPAGPTAPFQRSVLIQQVLAYLRQVPKYRRTRRQFVESFCSGVAPKISESMLDDVLRDMESTNLLALHNGVYSPAGEGMGFIESSRIFNNIGSAPPQTALVDADTGKTVAYVLDIDGAEGVRVAGQSFERVGDVTQGRQLVRRGGEHSSGPRYFSRSLPYAFDVGASVATRLGVRDGQLLVLIDGGELVVMTWLGRLLNLTLATCCAESEQPTTSTAFALRLAGSEVADITDTLQRAVASLNSRNPLAEASIERIVDMGPHFNYLSSDGQRRARQDWLERDFLSRWAEGLSSVRVIDSDSTLGQDLAALSRV